MGPSTSKDQESSKFRLSWSVSLSKIDQDSSTQESNSTNTKKRKEPQSPPKAKVSVKETKAKFELQEKYRNQRNLKDVNKDKTKFKRNCKKSPSEVVEDPIAKMLKDMMKDIKEIKTDVKGNNAKIDGLTEKVSNLETKNKEIEEENESSLKEIRGEIEKVEDRVTSKLMAEIAPSLNSMKNELQSAASQDIRRLVQEELAIQRMRESIEAKSVSKELEEVVEEGVGPEKN